MRLATLLLLSALKALCCSCASGGSTDCETRPYPDPNLAYFIGTVESVTWEEPQPLAPGQPLPLFRQRKVNFRVDEAFRGAADPFFAINSEDSNCEPKFATGTQYLVLAHRSNGRWTAGACSGTTLSRNAPYKIEALRSWKQGIEPRPAIHGRIQTSPHQDHNQPPPHRFQVDLQRGTDHRTTTTEADGSFVFPDVTFGSYRLIAYPSGRQPSGQAQWVDVSRSTCDARAFLLRPALGQIRGRLPGLPAGRLVSAVSPQSTRVGHTNANGDFTIEDLWPDEYTLTVEGQSPFPSKIKIQFADIINLADLPKP